MIITLTPKQEKFVLERVQSVNTKVLTMLLSLRFSF